LNKKALVGLKGTWSIPADIEARASLIIDETGERKIKQPEQLPSDATKPETWKVNAAKSPAALPATAKEGSK
jgi:hypothetical protein